MQPLSPRGGFVLASLFILSGSTQAQQLFSVRVNTAANFTQPVFATAAPGAPSTLYVVQQGGLIRTLDTTTGQIGGTTFLNLPNAIEPGGLLSGGERGLLGMAFHPNYAGTGAGSGLFYVYYNTPGTTSAYGVRVEEYHASGGVADPGSRRTIIQFDTPKSGTNTNHNAGWIGFNPVNGSTGPNSGQLYIMTGDSGGGGDPLNFAQNTNSLQGKVLRIDVNNPSGGNNYGIPAGNLAPGNGRPEIYAYGLRNPFRASFDRANGNLYIGDVGQSTREEINFIPNGFANTADTSLNFGWDIREGRTGPTLPGSTDPIYDYTWGAVGQSVTGGYVYRGENAELQGTYFFGDFVAQKVFSLRYTGVDIPTDTAADRTNELSNAINGGQINGVSSFAEDGFGNLFVIDYGGEVFRIVPVPEPGSIGLVLGGALLGVAGWRKARRRAA